MSGQEKLLSKALTIRYQPLPLSNFKWPLVEIGLMTKHRRLSQPTFGLVDSGASNSLLHPEVAVQLGFELNKIQRQSGGNSASGRYNFWILPKPVEVSLYGNRFLFPFQVIDSKEQMWPCVLGHDSIFKNAKVSFQTFTSRFEIAFRTDIN